MHSEVENILNDLHRVNISLVSLKEVHEDTKYYYYKDDGCFYKSGGEATTVIESTIGKGYFSNFWVASSRFLTSETSFKFADDLSDLKSDIYRVACQINSAALGPNVSPGKRNALHKGLRGLHGNMFHAIGGLSRLIKTYKADLVKQRVLQKVSKEFSRVIEEIEKWSNDIEDKLETDKIRIRRLKLQEEAKYTIDKTLERRSFSHQTRYSREKTSVSKRPGGLLPEELTEAATVDIFNYLELHKDELDKIIERQVAESSLRNSFIIRQEDSCLVRALAYYKDKVFVFLNEDSYIPGVVKVMRFSNIKIEMAIQSISHDRESLEQAKNQLDLLREYKGTRGIAKMTDVMTYLYEKGGHTVQSIFMQNYDQGSLYNCMKRKKLTFMEKCQVMLDVLHGVQTLHEDGRLHLNLHMRTICVDRPRNKSVTGALIGFENVIKEGEKEGFSKATDMWLLGHCMYALFTGEETSILKFLKTKTVFDVLAWKSLMKVPELKRDGALEDLILRLMHPNPLSRPCIRKAIELLQDVVQSIKKEKELTEALRKEAEISLNGQFKE